MNGNITTWTIRFLAGVLSGIMLLLQAQIYTEQAAIRESIEQIVERVHSHELREGHPSMLRRIERLERRLDGGRPGP